MNSLRSIDKGFEYKKSLPKLDIEKIENTI